MKQLDELFARAAADPRRIVLPEGEDPRIVEAAVRAVRDGIARIVVLGDDARIRALASAAGHDLRGIDIIDPAHAGEAEGYAVQLQAARAHKGMTLEGARDGVRDPLCFAAMMTRAGAAEGCVAGAQCPTADVVRTALQLVGRAPGCKLVSSFFIMMLCEPFHEPKGAMVFADCALNVAPDAGQLAQIALDSANSAQALLGLDPRVAMLSFSTNRSAAHAVVEKVAEATERVRARRPGLDVIGDVQLDAALVPSIYRAKMRIAETGSPANVLVFPSLEAGNIAYKIAERIGRARAVGPILQGLVQPVNDLSRGCSTNDVYDVIAVTVIQAQSVGPRR